MSVAVMAKAFQYALSAIPCSISRSPLRGIEGKRLPSRGPAFCFLCDFYRTSVQKTLGKSEKFSVRLPCLKQAPREIPGLHCSYLGFMISVTLAAVSAFMAPRMAPRFEADMAFKIFATRSRLSVIVSKMPAA